MSDILAENFAGEIRNYNSLVLRDSVATREDLISLSQCLSRLLTLAEILPDTFSDCDYEPEIHDRKSIEDKISKRFSDFGYYSSADPSPNLIGKEEALGVSDAVDDLADIYADLNVALMYYDKGISKNLFWYAKLMFGHWGAHAIELKRYLHKRLHDW